MAKIKKTLLRIMIVVLAIFVILFAIQLIDQVINGKTYTKIDAFFKEVNHINKSNDCNQNFKDIFDSINRDKNYPKYIILSPDIYDSAISSCNSLSKEIGLVEIPQDIPSERKVLLKNYINYWQQIIKDLYILMIERAKNCRGYKSCVFDCKTLFGSDSYKLQLLPKKIIMTKIHAKERLSVKQILAYPLEIYLDYQLKEFEQKEKDCLSKKKS